MKITLKNKHFTMEFSRVYDFYQVSNCIIRRAVGRNLLFNHKDLDKVLEIHKQVGLPAFEFFCEIDKKMHRLVGKELKPELGAVRDCLELIIASPKATPSKETKKAPEAKIEPNKPTKKTRTKKQKDN